MTFFSAFILFVTNFLVLNIFCLCLLYFYHRKKNHMDQEVHRRLGKEREKLENLSGDLLKVADLLLQRFEGKEKKMKAMIQQFETKMAQVEVKKIPVVHRSRNVVVKKKPQKVEKTTAIPVEKKENHQEYLEAGSKFKEIYYLADKGTSLVDIAKKTGKTKGEIELVLSLRKAQTI